MKKARLIGEAAFGRSKGQAKLWKVEPPVEYGYGDEMKTTSYIATSAVIVPYSGAETYVFPCDADGRVLNWAELDGSYRGGLDHLEAIRGAGYEIEHDFAFLLGQEIEEILGAEKGRDAIEFVLSGGLALKLYHEQDCCENVRVEDVCGDVADLIGSPILLAEEVTSRDNPEGINPESRGEESFTWTFYKLSTNRGSVTIRWYGESNGYYSESVDALLISRTK